MVRDQRSQPLNYRAGDPIIVIVFITHRADAYCDFSGNAPLPRVERGVRRNLRTPALGVGLLRPAQFGGCTQFAQGFLRQLRHFLPR